VIGVKMANDGVRFLVELAALASIGYWGFHEHSGWPAKIAFGLGGPILVASIWAVWMAPGSRRRAPERIRVLLEVVIFGLAVAALAASTGGVLAVIFGVVAFVNAVLDHRLADD
jgi:Protein of unknown function (DUF2568)